MRDPLPVPIPRRLPDRLDYFETLWWKVHADAIAAIEEQVANGWSRESAVESMATYTSWIAENIVHAVALAIFVSGIETAA